MRKISLFHGKVILMHGHGRMDWIGHCAGLVVVSAPSPVMEVTDEKPTPLLYPYPSPSALTAPPGY